MVLICSHNCPWLHNLTISSNSFNKIESTFVLFLPTTYAVLGKVIFSVMCVILSTGGGGSVSSDALGRAGGNPPSGRTSQEGRNRNLLGRPRLGVFAEQFQYWIQQLGCLPPPCTDSKYKDKRLFFQSIQRNLAFLQLKYSQAVRSECSQW